jgi:translocator protein
MSRSWFLPTMLAGSFAYALALLGATITNLGPWYQGLAQPAWAPPDEAFGAIWTLIFAMTALSAITAWRLAPTAAAASAVVGLFALNGFLGISWSLLFFRAKQPDWALAELGLLWLSIALLIVVCGRISRTAAWLLLPYLAWVSYAGLLNWEIVTLNGPF